MSFWTSSRRMRRPIQVTSGNRMPAFSYTARNQLTPNLQERYERRATAETVSTIVLIYREAENRFMVGGHAMRSAHWQRLPYSAALFFQSGWSASICRHRTVAVRNPVDIEISTETTEEDPKGRPSCCQQDTPRSDQQKHHYDAASSCYTFQILYSQGE